MTKLKQVTKTELAKRLGISRSSLYYQLKLPAKDEKLKIQIETVLKNNPEYGHKRIAIKLKLNKKRVLRVMRKFGIKPRRRIVKPFKPDDVNHDPTDFPNTSLLWCPVKMGVLWASDFTYLYFQDKFYYLATIIDVFTREIVGYSVANNHETNLVLEALKNALSKHKPPLWIHSDQGSKYRSKTYIQYCHQVGIKISMSTKGSPWHNPYQKSFYGKFKITLGFLDQFENLGQLIAGIHQALYYYNNERIHTALKMSPVAYKQTLIINKNDRLGV